MANRENFYRLLDLEPSVSDCGFIEQRIREKQREWSKARSQGNPKARRKADRCLALLKEIEAVLKDPETRNEEARQARKLIEQQRQAEAQELDEAIQVILASGGAFDQPQLAKLAERFKQSFSEAEVLKRLKAAGARFKGDPGQSKQQRRAKEQIDPVTAKSIRRNLDHLSQANLYDFLELSPRSSVKALSDRAIEIYKENQRIGRTDSEASARNELAGTCKSLFQSQDRKEKYDNYLAVEAMQGLKENLEIAGSDGFLSREEMDTLLKQALQRGVPTEEAKAYIEDYAQRRKWNVQPDADLPSEALQLCGFCSALASPGSTKCPQCGEGLSMDCPRCGAGNPTQNAACQSCGCQIGDAPLVKSLLKEGQRLALEGDFGEALRCVQKALHYWPDWKPAQEAAKKIRRKQDDREAEILGLQKQIAARQLVAARPVLERLERLYGKAGLGALRRQIEEGLDKAQAAFEQAQRHRRGGDLDRTLDCCDEALAACADFQPALQVMASSPPPPPANLVARSIGNRFRLTWKAAGSGRRVTYRVIRKTGSAPRDENDGEKVADVRAQDVDDAEAPVGAACFYAVYAVRGGVASHQAARCGPCLRKAEVDRLEASAGNREVILRWKSPPGCRRVGVWRKVGQPPAGPQDGTGVNVAGQGAHDTALKNGQPYGYLVKTFFEDPSQPGTETSTAGIKISATPISPPRAVEDLRCSRKGKTVLLSWTPVSDATVQIRQTTRLPEYSPGLILPISQADRFGTPLPSASANGMQVSLSGQQGQVSFVPLSVREGTAVAGKAVSVTTLDPVSALAARRSGRGIALTWSWPKGLDDALVCLAYDKFPQDPQGHQGLQFRVTRRQYERAGCWQLGQAERRRHYFTVFAKASGKDLYSEGTSVLENMGQQVAVSYRVAVKKSWLKRSIEEAWLELSCSDAARRDLPPMLVVGKVQAVPLSPKDGQVLAEIPGLRFTNGRATVPIPRQHWMNRLYVKMFFKDASHAQEVRLLPAERRLLRVS